MKDLSLRTHTVLQTVFVSNKIQREIKALEKKPSTVNQQRVVHKFQIDLFFQSHLLEELQLHFSVIGVTETKITNSNLPLDFDPSIYNYRFEYVPTLYLLEGFGGKRGPRSAECGKR